MASASVQRSPSCFHPPDRTQPHVVPAPPCCRGSGRPSGGGYVPADSRRPVSGNALSLRRRLPPRPFLSNGDHRFKSPRREYDSLIVLYDRNTKLPSDGSLSVAQPPE